MARNLAEVKIKVGFSLIEVISGIKELDPDDQEFFIENLLAVTSPEYLESIRNAREDYKRGRVIFHEELFKEKLK